MKITHFALLLAVGLSPTQVFSQQAIDEVAAASADAPAPSVGEVVVDEVVVDEVVVDEVVVDEVVATPDTVERVVADAIVVEEVDPATGEVKEKVIEEEVIEEAVTDESASMNSFFSEPLPSQSDFIPDDSLLMEPVVPTYGDDADFDDVSSVASDQPEPGVELRERIAMRKAYVKASRNEEVQAALAAANAEPFHKEQRRAMRDYYGKLFDQMRRIDGSMKERIDIEEAQQLALLRKSKRGLNDVVPRGSDGGTPSSEAEADDAADVEADPEAATE